MIITTKTKVKLAGMLYRTAAAARAMAGKGNRVIVRRDSLQWDLDLSEGIDFSIYLLGAFERSTVRALEKLAMPGCVVFDIGANIGSHTLGLARSVGEGGKVYAFEPADFAFAKLQRNLALNPDLDRRTRACQILLVADSTAPTQPELYASWPLKPNGPVHPKHRGRLVSASRAATDTLDSFVEREKIDRLDLIKIDVDGEEYAVLKGGRNSLARFQPVLLMEMQPYTHDERGHGFEALVGLLRDGGYSIEDAATGRKLPLRADDLRRLIPDGASLNVVARPARPGHPC